MRTVYYRALPFNKENVTLALESGALGLIVPQREAASVSSLARCTVVPEEATVFITLESKDDEASAAKALDSGAFVVLTRGWEIIPVENLLAHLHKAVASGAHSGTLALEVATAEEARLASGILEKGVNTVVVAHDALPLIRDIAASLEGQGEKIELSEAVITEITPVGMGHRVCVDTLSCMHNGQGMLVGNSAAFTFLVNAETEHNEYVASRPFRVNAGAVHAYAILPGDKTRYLEELLSGSEVLIVDHKGDTETAIVGRAKVEKRPMLLVRAKSGDNEGAVFLQNAETIRLVQPGGQSISVVSLKPGDSVLCRLDSAGRHFGIRISENITEA